MDVYVKAMNEQRMSNENIQSCRRQDHWELCFQHNQNGREGCRTFVDHSG